MTEAEKKLHRCCFTGQRPEKLESSEETIRSWLGKQIDEAVAKGFTTFITGMAMGVDLWAAEAVLEKKKSNPDVHLIAATPYPTFCFGWHEDWKKVYGAVWNAADFRTAVCPEYADDAFEKRNAWMVDRSGLVIAWYNGDAGASQHMIDYAKQNGVPVTAFNESEMTAGAWPGCLLDRLSEEKNWPEDIEARLTVAMLSLQTRRDIDCVEMRYREGKTLQRIGDAFGIPQERVRQILERSEKRLKNELPFLNGEKSEDEKQLKKEWIVGKIKK